MAIACPYQSPAQLWLCPLQNFTGASYAGLVYDSPEELRDYSVRGKWRIPINMHIGNMGLAPAVGAPIITAPPGRTGGNIDNKRIGIGGKQHGNRGLCQTQCLKSCMCPGTKVMCAPAPEDTMLCG